MRLHLSEFEPYADPRDAAPRHDRQAKCLPSHLDSNPSGGANLDIFRAAHKDASRARIDKVTREPGSRPDEPDNNLAGCLSSFSAPAWHA